MPQIYGGLGGYTAITQGRNILATLVSGGKGGGGYAGKLTTSIYQSQSVLTESRVPSSNAPLVLTVLAAAGRSINLAFSLLRNDTITIDWGDNKTSAYDTPYQYSLDLSAGRHIYDLSGNYTVSVTGLLSGFNGFRDIASAETLRSIISWGNLGIVSLDFACNNISNYPVPSTLPSSVLSLRNMFENSIYTRNDIATWNVSRVTDMSNMFAGTTFNSSISSWFNSENYNDRNVLMARMFANSLFSQNISSWLVRSSNHTGFTDTTGGNLTTATMPTFVDDKQPTNLTTTVIDVSSVALSWTNNNNPTYVRIQYKLSSTETWTTSLDASGNLYRVDTSGNISQLDASGTVYNSRTFTVKGLNSASRYEFRVSAFNTDGWTIPSNIAIGVTPVRPPMGLSATTVTASSINLTWTNNDASITDTVIEYSLDNITWEDIPNGVLGSARAFNVTGLAASTLYRFRIATSVGTARSVNSAVLSSATLPNAPFIQSAVGLDTSAVELIWGNNSTPVSTLISYDRVYPFTSVRTKTVSGNSSLSVVTDLSAATKYYFTAQTVDANGKTSASSNLVSEATTPYRPTNLALTNITTTSVRLNWTPDPLSTASLIEADISGGAWDGNTQTYQFRVLDVSGLSGETVSELLAETAYQFRVTSIAYGSLSEQSSVATTYTSPYAPTELAASLGVGDASGSYVNVNLSWNNTTVPDDSVIEYKLSSSPTWLLAPNSNLGAATTAVITSQLGMTYNYRVSTVKNSIRSLPSNTVTLTTPTAPAAPTDLSGTLGDVSGSNVKVNLRWTNTIVPDNSVIEYKLTSSPTWLLAPISIVGAATTAAVTSLTGSTYNYRVSSIKTSIKSLPSNVIIVAT